MPKITVVDEILETCDFHEVLEAFAGQSHLIQIGHYSNHEHHIFEVSKYKLPEGYYSFTQTKDFTTETPYLNEAGKEVGTSVHHNLGELELSEYYDDFEDAMVAAYELIVLPAHNRVCDSVSESA
jgi:hypothetical protein